MIFIEEVVCDTTVCVDDPVESQSEADSTSSKKLFTVIGFLFKLGRIRPLSHLQPKDSKKQYFCLFLSGWDGRTDGRTDGQKLSKVVMKRPRQRESLLRPSSSALGTPLHFHRIFTKSQ